MFFLEQNVQNITVVVISQASTKGFDYMLRDVRLHFSAVMLFETTIFMYIIKIYCGMFLVESMGCDIYCSFTKQHKIIQMHCTLSQIFVKRTIFCDLYLT